MNHRRIQRTLFRMFLDEGFRQRVLAGHELEGFDSRERALLTAVSPACLSADRDGKRAGQVLGNLVGEYVLSFAVAPAAVEASGFPHSFFGSPGFHDAVARDRRLPLAFAEYVESVAEAHPDALFSSFASLEVAMARARRSVAAPPPLAANEIVVAAGVEFVELPAGTVELAERMRSALDAKREPPSAGELGAGNEREFAMAVRRPRANPRALADVAVEALSPPVKALLDASRSPLPQHARAAIARGLGADPEALEAFVDSLVDDGVVVRG